MTTPVQIVWRGLAPSEALSEKIHHHAEQLNDALSCRVVVERPSRTGFAVKVEIAQTGEPLLVANEPAPDAYAAVNGAFEKADRSLHSRAPRRRAALRRARRGR